MKSVIVGRLALVAVIFELAACARAGTPADNGAASAGAANSAWVKNGASACQKYLTPDVLAAILLKPAGATARINDGQACHTDAIYINLKVADIDVFRQEVPRIVDTHPFAGVGDGAYWNAAGTSVAAVKGHTRGCDISVIGAATKIQNEALAQKLGEVCNKLFALP